MIVHFPTELELPQNAVAWIKNPSNGILFIRFPVVEIAAALSRSPQTCKRSLNELEQAGMIMRVRQGIGEVSHIYILLPKEDAE